MTLYVKPDCVGCAATERALKKGGTSYDKIDLNERPDLVEAFRGQGITRTPVVETRSGQRWAGHDPSKMRERGLEYRAHQRGGNSRSGDAGRGR
ncbi:glutaredoxin domain-containing protein [Brachybacterium nesterenkovii]|uniref:glutaredoxin domain-containing protein n=1 Tax=Brachybacterium nesterenkovii TaxID=47847 RepID=UPI003D2724A1